MKKIIFLLFILPAVTKAQFVLQGVATSSGNTFTLNGISQTPYAGRFFHTAQFNLNNDFDLKFTAYLGNTFNNGMAFLFYPSAVTPTTTNPPTVISVDNIQNFGTGSIANNFVIEFDVRGSFCVAGQNVNYEPTTDINHIAYWKNNSPCTFGNYYSPYSALGTLNYYAYEPYRIKWKKSTNTLETYYNNALIKSNVVDLVGLLGTSVYWGFSAGCYCVPGGPSIQDMFLNGNRLLPITIKSFTGETNNKSVNLKWVTTNESNSAYFDVEKSIDGANFSFIQKIAAAGNSETERTYRAMDQKIFEGTNFYRLKMVDKDGHFNYSNILAIKVSKTDDQVSIFPNPAKRILQVQIPSNKKEDCTIQIQDMLGKIVNKEIVQLNNALFATAINLDVLEKGVYLLVVIRGGDKQITKFIKD